MNTSDPDYNKDAVVVTDLRGRNTHKSSWLWHAQTILKRRRRLILWAMVALLLCVASYLFTQPFHRSQVAQTPTLASPNQTLSTFCGAMKTEGVSSAYQQFSAATVNSRSQSRFLHNTQQEFTGFHGLQDCGVLVIANNGMQATVLFTCTVNDPPRNSPQIILKADMRNEHGTWKMLDLADDPAYSDPW